MAKKPKKPSPKRKSKPAKKATAKLTGDEKNSLNSFCNIFGEKWDEAGQFIDAETAGRGHKKWRSDNAILRDPDDDKRHYTVTANYFSKSKVMELLSREGCNGFRIYFCKSRGLIGDKVRKYRDVFLMPTQDGKDMIAIKEHVRKPGVPIPHDENGRVQGTRNEGILNSSFPCPDHCNSLYQK